MKFLSLFLVFGFILSCTPGTEEEENPLAGTTWELTSGKWSREDTTFTFPNSPYDQGLMIFTETHWVYMHQDTSRDVNRYLSGTYRVDGHNLPLILEMCKSYEDIGKSINWKFQIDGNQLFLKSEHHFSGYDWKSDQVWKRID